MSTRTAGTARRIVMAAAAATLTMGLATACGGEDEGKSGTEKSDKDSASATPEATPTSGVPPEATDPAVTPVPEPPSTGRTLTKAELTQAALVTGDVPNYVVTPMQGGDEPGTEQADKPECRPLAAVINGAPEPAASATVYRTIVDGREEGNERQTVVTEILTAHANGAADAVLKSVRTAVEACAAGFTTHGGEGGASTYSEVKKLSTPRVGDDAIAYQVTGAMDGAKVPLVFHVVRRGATVATFYAANFIDARTPEIPALLAQKQSAKLP
ncbi:hypothetical protein [Streptomyces formicae]|uniref:Lipoprotein n=1 Tax=Streptomyces formicae TaxID=1616117 RepID=A0ABY3WHE9_9ACTN|nr:hypothetical protein [Streptomyces formicae]UNM11036.1 hypothetical protein J4032_05490 [Streptomyces formicae]